MDQHLYNDPSDNQITDAEAVWKRCMDIIKDNIPWRSFQTWFEPVKAANLKSQVLTLQVPSQFFYEWLEEHYVDLLGKTIKRILGKEGRLEYRIMMESSSSKKNPASVNIPGSTFNRSSKESNFVDMPMRWDDINNIKTPYAIPGLKRVQIDPQLNANYTFENFVEGECNRLARSAGLRIAQKPGETSFNPIIIFGDNGWGKTHLVQAIGNEVRQLHPHKAVLYVSADKFINQFIDHSKTNDVNDFVHFYQLIDVLILDDIHLFMKAPKTQDVFFAIFNHLHQSGKQIILTSDTAPRDLEGLQDRLLSRFRWGLNADMTAPDFETRQEILQVKMRREGMEIPEEVVKYVSYNVSGNVRELEGAVIALFAQATLNKKEIDLDLAKRVMKNFVRAKDRELTVDNLQKLVCDFFSVPYEELRMKVRRRDIVKARQITMFLAHQHLNASLKEIGSKLGGFDHTTVIHSCKTVSDLMQSDPSYKQEVDDLQQKIKLTTL